MWKDQNIGDLWQLLHANPGDWAGSGSVEWWDELKRENAKLREDTEIWFDAENENSKGLIEIINDNWEDFEQVAGLGDFSFSVSWRYRYLLKITSVCFDIFSIVIILWMHIPCKLKSKKDKFQQVAWKEQ